MQENGLIRKLVEKLFSKFMMSSTVKLLIKIPILPNIPRSKGNQKMKFSQLIEHKMRNIFLKKSFIKCGGETSPRPFLKN